MKTSKKQAVETLQSIGTLPLKSFGQNFITDKKIIHKIIASCQISCTDHILEIGPGIGTLTQYFLKKGARVTAVEKDKKLFQYLTEFFLDDEHLNLIQGNILKIPFEKPYFQSTSYKIISNLPYNISSQVLLKIIMHSELFEEVFLGLQKEVAMRISSKEGSKVYGLLSPFVQLEYKAKVLFSIPAQSFHPAPRVTSAFLRLKRFSLFSIQEKHRYFQFLKLCFSHRRKKLLNNLKKSYPEIVIGNLFEDLHINRNFRAENISPDLFHKMFKILEPDMS